jgi:hypothetical protein
LIKTSVLQLVSGHAGEVHGMELAGNEIDLVEGAAEVGLQYFLQAAGQEHLELEAMGSRIDDYGEGAAVEAFQGGVDADFFGHHLVPDLGKAAQLFDLLGEGMLHQHRELGANMGRRIPQLPLLPDCLKLRVIHDKNLKEAIGYRP